MVGKHVVVSGGGTGVGAGIASQFSKASAKVTLLGRRLAPLEETAARTGAAFVSCDVTDRASVDEALQHAREINGPISIAVANAGAAISKPFVHLSAEDLSTSLSVNVMGVFNLWQAALPDMQASGWGRLVAIASTAGLKGYPYVTGYCAAKHGVVGMTRALSIELARSGVTVNAVCPGFVETPMLDASIANIVDKTGMSFEDAANTLKRNNPMKRFIKVAEVADAVLWLAQEGSGSVNGQAISINGGEV